MEDLCAGSSQTTEKTREQGKKNAEELFKTTGNKSLTGYFTRMKNRKHFVAFAKLQGMTACHYLLHRPRIVQPSVLLRMVLETGKRR
jgi:hypothetical protein